MIIEKIKKETGIDVRETCRKREHVELKALASHLFKQQGLSLQQIAIKLRLKNHATIINHLKIYEQIKHYNPKIEELEDLITGKKRKPPTIVEIDEKEEEVVTLKNQIKELQTNKYIQRLLPLLDNENTREKFKAFVEINEKTRYYKKYE